MNQRNRKGVITAFSAALVLAVSLLCAAALPGSASATTPQGSDVFTLPVPDGYKYYADSYEDTVVWAGDLGIWGYDVSEAKLFQVPTPDGFWVNRPRIFGNRIVFHVQSPEDQQDIVGWDRSTDTTFDVTTAPEAEGNYEMSGDTVVYVSPDESDDADIFGKNLKTGATFTVTKAAGCQSGPDISGEWVVYEDWGRAAGSHGTDVKAYNIRTKKTKVLCDWSGDQYNATIGPTGFVAWQSVSDPKHPVSTTDLYGCDVVTGEIRRIAGGPGSQASPTVGGTVVLYKDSRKPGGFSSVGYDLLSGTRFGIAGAGDIAGFENGTIASLDTPYAYPLNTSVSLIWPTELDVIATDDSIYEAIDEGEDGIIPEPTSTPVGSARRSEAASPASSVTTVVVAAASDWTGTVVGSSLAGRYSPLLLTSTASMPSAVRTKLAALAPEHVVVVGGPLQVSSKVLEQIAAIVGAEHVTRLDGTSAKTRSVSAAKSVAAVPGWDGTVLVCPRNSASTAFAAVPASVYKGYPLLLVDSKGLSATQVSELTSAGATRFVVVGAGVPSKTMGLLRAALGDSNTTTVVGDSLASTSAKFARWSVTYAGMTWDRLAIASYSDWSHTPIAALVKGRRGNVLLVTSPKSLSSAIGNSLRSHDREIRRVDFVGKKAVVSTAVRSQVRLIVK